MKCCCWFLLLIWGVSLTFEELLDLEQCVTSTDKTRVTFLWDVGQFQLRSERGQESLRSPDFHQKEIPSSWRIVLYPSVGPSDEMEAAEEAGDIVGLNVKQCMETCMVSVSKGPAWVDKCLAECEEWKSKVDEEVSGKPRPHQRFVGLYLCLDKANTYPQRILFTMSLLRNQNSTKSTVVSKSSSTAAVFNQGNCKGWKEFLPRRKVISQQLSHGHLRILSEVDLLNDSELCSHPGKEFSDMTGEQTECLRTSRLLEEELMSDKHRMSDIRFMVQQSEFKVHRAILSARSPLLLQSLNQNKKSNSSSPLDDAKSSDMLQLLQYVYGGRVPEALDLGPELLVLAQRLGVSGLIPAAQRLLEQSLDVTTAARVLWVADAHGMDVLRDRAWEVILGDPQSVMETDTWKDLVQNAPHLASEAFRRMVEGTKATQEPPSTTPHEELIGGSSSR